MQANKIIKKAIDEWQPVHIVILFSGGYDSMALAHWCANNYDGQLPISTWSIDTCLSADGWTDYIEGVAEELNLPDFHIYRNEKGFAQYLEWVREYGCPRGLAGHKRAYARLKERAIDAIHMMYKTERSSKTLFLSGIRQSESREREKLTAPIQRMRKSNKVFANPLFCWSDEDVMRYRLDNDLPDNPFYSTVSGSGDCQCNWGNFITLGTLQIHSPVLAAGNVAEIDAISKECHGYGWDGSPAMESLFNVDEYLDTPYLCSNCSRRNKRTEAEETVILQRLWGG